MSRIRIVVADQAEAVFYDAASLGMPLKEVAKFTDAAAHQHDRDFCSDRPGRTHASVGSARTPTRAKRIPASSKPCASHAGSRAGWTQPGARRNTSG